MLLRNVLKNPWESETPYNHFWLLQLLKIFKCPVSTDGACFGYAGMALHEAFAGNLEGSSDRIELLRHIPGALLWEKAKNLAIQELDDNEVLHTNRITSKQFQELSANIDFFEKELIETYIQDTLYNLMIIEEKISLPYYDELFGKALTEMSEKLAENFIKAGRCKDGEFDMSLLTPEENETYSQSCQEMLKQLLYCDIAYFLRGIHTYQESLVQKETVENSATQINALATQLEYVNAENFKNVISFTGAYTLKDLTNLFKFLENQFKKNQIPTVVFLLNYGLHAAAIIYDQNGWTFKEANTALHIPERLNRVNNPHLKIAAQALNLEKSKTVVGFTLYGFSKDHSVLVRLMANIKKHSLWQKIHTPTNTKAQFRNQDQISWLHLAAQFGEIDQLQALISLKIPLDCKDCCDSTPLNKALAFKQLESMNILLINGANPNSANTPLCIAARLFPESAKLLIAYKAYINVLDKDYHKSPLFYAVEEGNGALVALLLDNGADLDLPLTNNGEKVSLIDLAKQQGFYEIAELLIAARESKRDKQSVAALIQLNSNEQRGKKRSLGEEQDLPPSENRNSYPS